MNHGLRKHLIPRFLSIVVFAPGLLSAQHVIEVGEGPLVRPVLVEASGPWTVEDNVPWLSVSMEQGYGIRNVDIVVENNGTGVDRTDSITIAGETYTITQRAAGSGLRELWAMGSDEWGQLGAGRYVRTSPIPILDETELAPLEDIQSVAAGRFHSLYVKTDGTLWGMGSGFSATPVQVGSSVTTAAAGGAHSLFVKSDHTLWAMGLNNVGQIGDGTTISRPMPVQVAIDVDFVAAGGSHSLIVTADGTLWAVGDNSKGQLGDGTTSNRTVPLQVATDVVSVAAGWAYSLFVRSDGTLWAMGSNSVGQLGDGTTTDRLAPIQVADDVASVSAGDGHTLFVKNDNTLWGMGRNSGQLGGETAPVLSPVLVDTDVVSAAAGQGTQYSAGGHTLFVKTDGTLWTMGDNTFGQLGAGVATFHDRETAPTQVASDVASVAAGDGHSLFVKTDGTLWGMGRDFEGQLGVGTLPPRTAPVQVAGDIAMFATAVAHSLFVKTDETLWAVGDNTYGQLGDGTMTYRFEPVQVASDVVSVATSELFSMFVKSDGTLWAMGYNSSGELGDGTKTWRATPVLVASEVAPLVATGAHHSLFLKTDGTLWGMGTDYRGELGLGTPAAYMTPVQLSYNVTAFAASFDFSLFVKTDGSLWAMGLNHLGQLGDGTTTNRSAPVQVATDVTFVATGGAHSLFVKTDGTLWAMGYNAYGQLGDGTTTNRNMPVQVASDVAFASAGNIHSFFVKTDTSLWAMGYNTNGQLGDGTTEMRLTPALVADEVVSISAAHTHTLFIANGDIRPLPKIVVQPATQAAAAGSKLPLSVEADGYGEFTYQWFLDGVAVTNGTSGVFTWPSVQRFHAGDYTVTVTNKWGSVTSDVATLTIETPPPSDARLLNLSTRALTLTGDNVVIPGFVIRGTESKRLLIRAVGPTLALDPFNVPGVLPDPRMILKRWNGTSYDDVAENDNWSDNTNAGEIPQTAAELFAFGFRDDREAALLIDLPAGQYTLLVDGVDEAAGVSVVELYDADASTVDARLINISTRGFVGVGAEVIIPGFVVSSEGPKTFLIRVVGPRLANAPFHVPGTMDDPKLELYGRAFGGTDALLFAQDNWSDNPDAANTAATAASVYAFALADGSADAAFVVTLEPGIYTVVGSSADGVSIGVALVEVYVVE